MSRHPVGHDLAILIRGLKKLGAAAVELRSNDVKKVWANTSLRPLTKKGFSVLQENVDTIVKADISKNVYETADRLSVVALGLQAYMKNKPGSHFQSVYSNQQEIPYNTEDFQRENFDAIKDPVNGQQLFKDMAVTENKDNSLGIGIQSEQLLSSSISQMEQSMKNTSELFDSIIEQRVHTKPLSDEDLTAIDEKVNELQMSGFSQDINSILETNEIPPIVEKKLPDTNESQKFVATEESISFSNKDTFESPLEIDQPSPDPIKPMPNLIGRKPLSKNKPQSTLSSAAQARKVPNSQIGRLLAFGSLAAGLGMGALAEVTRQAIGGKVAKSSGSLLDSSKFLTEANAERIVATLCKVRGAALKLGQMLSIQDDSIISPQLQKILERVRQSADFMPSWQLERTLVKSLGAEWRSLVSSFDDHPFAAASIGQVHEAILHDGTPVAMKIQYPGVAEGIDSDINNLISTLKYAQIFPAGLYVDSAIEVAKRELAWECDYEREKACTIRYKKLIAPYPDYYVPEVIDQLCTKEIFTTELIDGIPVDKCINLDQETRNRICKLILELCLREVFEFGFMQTDPNWSNFFYNEETKQIALLDFGACREYKKEFVDDYINVIHSSARQDREKVLEYSKNLKFLSGHEAKIMEDAHIDAVMILGEAFQKDEPFHFGAQHTTHRIQHLIPVMLSHRMCAPPEESYSLHRKMSGVFLLCAKLGGIVNCKPFFDNLYNNYKEGGTWDSNNADSIR